MLPSAFTLTNAQSSFRGVRVGCRFERGGWGGISFDEDGTYRSRTKALELFALSQPANVELEDEVFAEFERYCIGDELEAFVLLRKTIRAPFRARILVSSVSSCTLRLIFVKDAQYIRGEGLLLLDTRGSILIMNTLEPAFQNWSLLLLCYCISEVIASRLGTIDLPAVSEFRDANNSVHFAVLEEGKSTKGRKQRLSAHCSSVAEVLRFGAPSHTLTHLPTGSPLHRPRSTNGTLSLASSPAHPSAVAAAQTNAAGADQGQR